MTPEEQAAAQATQSKNTPAGKPAAEQAATPFTVAGKTFSVADFVLGETPQQPSIQSAKARASEVYAALPTEYKSQADKLKDFLLNYKELLGVTGEAGGSDLAARYSQWVKDGMHATGSAANEQMHKIHLALAPKIKEAMDADPTLSEARATGNILSFIGGVGDGFLGFIPRAQHAGSTLTGAAKDKFDFTHITSDQAEIYSRLYAGLLCDARTHDATLPMIDWPGKGSKIFSNVDVTLLALSRYIASLIKRVFEAVTGKGWRGMPDFTELFNEEKTRKQNGKITTILSEHTIAGIAESPQIATALSGGVTSGRDGSVTTVTADRSGLNFNTLTDEHGNKITVVGAAVDAASGAFTNPTTNKNSAAQTGYWIGTGTAGILAGAAAITGVAHAPKILHGAASGFKETYENKPLERAAKYHEKIDGNLKGAKKIKPELFAKEGKTGDPRTWFSNEPKFRVDSDIPESRLRRAEFREGQYETEVKAAASRAKISPEAAVNRADAVSAFEKNAPKIKLGTRISEFFSHPFTSTGEAVGGLAGRVADGTDRAVRGIAKDFGMMMGDSKAIITGSNAALKGSSKIIVRAASLGRAVPRGLGVASVILGATGDTFEGVEAAKQHDGHHVAKQAGRVVGGAAGGIAGGAAAGAAAGAAIGVWFGGIGAIPAGVIGGAVGMLGAWGGFELGRMGGGAATEAVAGDFIDRNVYKKDIPGKHATDRDLTAIATAATVKAHEAQMRLAEAEAKRHPSFIKNFHFADVKSSFLGALHLDGNFNKPTSAAKPEIQVHYQ